MHAMTSKSRPATPPGGDPRPGDSCPSCGPSYKLLLRDLARCGRKGPGEGAYCAVCRSVWALPAGAAPAM
ncbi:MAG: hypothetical protein NW203_15020 [Hyphomonadaceae bacterium]|nr:hypothetical protein [Hyphomonadaceae bacterium]